MRGILLTSGEIRNADFPNVCFVCGEHGCELVPRRLEQVRYERSLFVRYRTTTSKTVELPFCRDHARTALRRRGGLLGIYGNAKFVDKGIWVFGASEEFIEALWERREKKYRRQERESRRGREEEERDPSDRPQRGDPDYEELPSSGSGGAGCVLAIVGAVAFAAVVGVALVLFVVLSAVGAAVPPAGPPRPGFGPAPHGPLGPEGRPGRRW
jgi:hypothetical protein